MISLQLSDPDGLIVCTALRAQIGQSHVFKGLVLPEPDLYLQMEEMDKALSRVCTNIEQQLAVERQAKMP